VANEVSPAFDAWWERASTRKAEGRFQNAQELANALGDAFGIGSRLTVPSLPPRRAFSSAPAGVELRDAASADVSGVRERADLASVVISDSANKPSSGDAQLRLGSLPSDLAAMAPASPALPGTVVPASAVTELRSSSLPVTMLAQRSQLGLSGFEWQQHRWLYAGLAAGLALVIIAIFALASGDNDSRPAGAAQPPDHLAEMEPMRAAQPATEPSIEVKPADTPAIDLVRPEELDMEPEPKPSATPAPLAPRRAPARPSRNSNKRDYGI
jgi:serine/threonine-protein kinase